MNKSIKRTMTILVISLFIASDAFSWDDERTHKDLSTFAAENSVINKSKGDYLKNLGYDQGLEERLRWDGSKTIREGYIIDWLLDGASLEDTGNWWNTAVGSARFVNHFHSPLKDWSNAGLTDVLSGESSLLWAQDGANQSKFLEGDRSWKTIRNLYYLALTSNTEAERQSYFAQAFRGLVVSCTF